MITNDFKLIFVHVPKCAGRSINDVFNQRFDHFTARYYEKEYEQQWNSSEWLKFTIVRNPFDRLLSIYTYMMQHRRHIMEPVGCVIGGKFTPTFDKWVEHNLKNYNGTFDWNSAEGGRGKDGDLGSAFWFASQSQRIASWDCEIKNFDKIFRHEEGMRPIEEFLGKLMGDVSVPLTNQSADLKRDYRDYYSAKTRHLAENFSLIIEDCERLGYSF